MDFFEQISDEYGAEEQGLIAEEDGEGVSIPSNQFELTEAHRAELEQEVNAEGESDCYGIDLYQQTLNFVYQTVAHNFEIYGTLL